MNAALKLHALNEQEKKDGHLQNIKQMTVLEFFFDSMKSITDCFHDRQ